jgi:hypothetical protein
MKTEKKYMGPPPQPNQRRPSSGLVYFFSIFTPKRCRDIWGFGVHPILSNPLKYSSPKYSTMMESF